MNTDGNIYRILTQHDWQGAQELGPAEELRELKDDMDLENPRNRKERRAAAVRERKLARLRRRLASSKGD